MTEAEHAAILKAERFKAIEHEKQVIRTGIAQMVDDAPGEFVDLDYPAVARSIIPLIFAFRNADGERVIYDGSGRVVAARIKDNRLEVEVIPQEWRTIEGGDCRDLGTVWTTIPPEALPEYLIAIERLLEHARDKAR